MRTPANIEEANALHKQCRLECSLCQEIIPASKGFEWNRGEVECETCADEMRIEKINADRIDGYDRDNIGLSPDF